MELLAQVIEEVSILTSKKFARKEPRKIKRPAWVSGEGGPEPDQRGGGNPFSRAIDTMLNFGAPSRGAEGGAMS